MTSKRSIIFFWALILVPTLILSAFALHLLSNEQKRINQTGIGSLTDRAQTISETIHLTVETVQENIASSLLKLEQDNLLEGLISWEETNPLIRNVFIYNADKKLEYPLQGKASTEEEQRFMARYNSLFSGRISFDFNQNPSTEEEKLLKREYQKNTLYSRVPKKEKSSSRQELVALSKVKLPVPDRSKSERLVAAQKAPYQNEPLEESVTFDEKIILSKAIERSGWTPWFSENRLYILGWVQKIENGPVYGIELELMTLLSRLLVSFPDLFETRAALMLMDGNGKFMHQTGTLEVAPEDKPVSIVNVSDLLPHWRIAVFVDEKGLGKGNGFLVVSILLLAIFIVAILSGGYLLTRFTLQNILDAQQKTSFVSSVSHELKTPLTSIRMYAELLLSKRVKDEEKMQTYLSVIVNESGRLTRLINNVLDFGKLEQRKKTYRKSTFKLDQFLSQIVETHGIRIKKQGLRLDIKIKGNDFTIKSDQDALEQVILNLLDNALKYAGQGEFIKFILEKAIPDKSNPFILLKICDDGPGIPVDQQTLIFKKFYRVDSSLTSKQPGSGLGLSIARQILRDLGGELTYEFMPENGSCFIARIKNHDAD